MLVPKKNRQAVYSYLFQEGVLCCKKDYTMEKHPHIEVPNLHVCKLMQSLKSRGYVKENFSWRWYYYMLTDDGIDHLRKYLHVDPDTVPNTLKKATKPQPPPSFGRDRFEGGRGRGRGRGGGRGRGRGGGRGDYRGEKSTDAPRDFKPRYEGGGEGGRGGYRGRGRGRGGYGGRTEE